MSQQRQKAVTLPAVPDSPFDPDYAGASAPAIVVSPGTTPQAVATRKKSGFPLWLWLIIAAVVGLIVFTVAAYFYNSIINNNNGGGGGGSGGGSSNTTAANGTQFRVADNETRITSVNRAYLRGINFADSKDGVFQGAVDGFMTCVNNCAADPSCTGFDYIDGSKGTPAQDISPKSCWLWRVSPVPSASPIDVGYGFQVGTRL